MKKTLVKKWFIAVSKQVAWAPTSIFLIHVVASKVFNLYMVWPEFDIPMHFLGGVTIAYFFHGAYKIAHTLKLLGEPDYSLQIIMTFALASTTTIIWEFAEFISDHLLGTHMQGGLEDTLLDMLLGMVGAAIALVLCANKERLR